MGEAARTHDDSAMQVPIDLLPGMSEVFSEIEEYLDDRGKRNFRDEVYRASLEMFQTRSSKPFNDVIQAWYRTLLFKRSGVDARLAELPEENADEAMTLDEVREYLKL